MTKSEFEQKLDDVLGLDKPTPKAFTEMYHRLEQVASQLETRLNGNGKGHHVNVVLEPGHVVNAGQQFNVAVLIPKLNSFRDVLFRAYIPPVGKPVALDLTGEMPVMCPTPKVLEQRVLEFFALDSVQGRLRTL